MCMGYANDIAAWACQAELSRRNAIFQAWGETWIESKAQAKDTEQSCQPPVAALDSTPSPCAYPLS